MKEEEAGKEGSEEVLTEVKEEASEEQTNGSVDEKQVEPQQTVPEEPTNVQEKEGEEPTTPEVFDEDEKALFDRLMQKIQDAGDLDKELDSDFNSFEERVESVVDSIDRIEKIERTSLEELIYKHDDEDEVVETEAPPTEKGMDDDEPSPIEIGKEGETPAPPEETERSPQDDIGLGQIYVSSESPYEEIKKGEITFDDKGDLLDTYGNEVETVLKKMLKLIRIKLKKEQMNEARDLLRVSANLGGTSSLFQKEFVPIAHELGIAVPENRELREEDIPVKAPTSIDDMSETQVLDPELAEEITILQKRATSAIKQLETLISTSDIEDEELNKIKAQYETSMEMFRNKMFHKAYEVALEALGSIKDRVQDNIDNQLQADLYRTKEMLEEFSKNPNVEDPNMLDDLKTTFDRAMKAYLTNEFERANLLTKKVLNTILDMSGEGGGPMKEKIEDLKKELRELKEKNIPSKEIDDILDVVRSAENFIDRRDIPNAEKIIKRIEGSIIEIKDKSERYTAARELEIKLTNRVDRLKDVIFDLETVRKKLEFVHNYFREERYEDVLIIGAEINDDLEMLERTNKETESKYLMEKLESLISSVELLDDAKTYKNRYNEILKAYEENDLSRFKSNGTDLAEELSTKLKTIGVKRAKEIATLVVEARLLKSKLVSLNIDTVEMERKIRKGKNLIKESEYRKGIDMLHESIEDMKNAYLKHLDYLKDYLNIYRDSLEVVMDRHKEEAIVYHLKRKHVPVLRKMAEVGHYHKALEIYKILESKLTEIITTEDKKDGVEEELNEIKFEIYKRKEEGLDISEPLSLYTQAQKRYGAGEVVPAEYLAEVSRRYCEAFMPI